MNVGVNVSELALHALLHPVPVVLTVIIVSSIGKLAEIFYKHIPSEPRNVESDPLSVCRQTASETKQHRQSTP